MAPAPAAIAPASLRGVKFLPPCAPDNSFKLPPSSPPPLAAPAAAAKNASPSYIFFPACLLRVPEVATAPGTVGALGGDAGLQDWLSRLDSTPEQEQSSPTLQQQNELLLGAAALPSRRRSGSVLARGQEEPLPELWSSSSDAGGEGDAVASDAARQLKRASSAPPRADEKSEGGGQHLDEDEAGIRCSVCVNFSEATEECQARELDRDVLEGLSIHVLPSHSSDSGQPQRVLYAFYFASASDTPVLPGDATTALLFPEALQLRAAADRSQRRASTTNEAATCTVMQIGRGEQGGDRRSVTEGLRGGFISSLYAPKLASFSEWRELEEGEATS